jgi:hypothetical protein
MMSYPTYIWGDFFQLACSTTRSLKKDHPLHICLSRIQKTSLQCSFCLRFPRCRFIAEHEIFRCPRRHWHWTVRNNFVCKYKVLPDGTLIYCSSKELIAFTETLLAFAPYYRINDLRIVGPLNHFWVYADALADNGKVSYELFTRNRPDRWRSCTCSFRQCHQSPRPTRKDSPLVLLFPWAARLYLWLSGVLVWRMMMRSSPTRMNLPRNRLRRLPSFGCCPGYSFRIGRPGYKRGQEILKVWRAFFFCFVFPKGIKSLHQIVCQYLKHDSLVPHLVRHLVIHDVVLNYVVPDVGTRYPNILDLTEIGSDIAVHNVVYDILYYTMLRYTMS